MKPVRLLLLSFYYPPDISAGAFRAQSLVQALEHRLPQGSELHVVTTMPNRFGIGNYQVPAVERLPGGKTTITRVTLPSGGSGMASQAWAFLHYAFRVLRHSKERRYDLVVATSSRLMPAVLGRWLAARHKARLYQDIRDIFVDNLPHVLPLGAGRLLAPLFAGLERWALGPADGVNLVSRGFESYFVPRYPHQRFTWHTNGIDSLFVEAVEQGRFMPADQPPVGGPLKVLYAGNLGAGQGLEHILPGLAARLTGRAEFLVIGDGGARAGLEQALEERGVTNVELRTPQPREQVLELYRHADVLFLHLDDIPSFTRVLPSKLFEYAATGKPIWAGVAGYPASFVEQEIDNAVVFPPCDLDGALAALERLEIHSRPRPAFVAKWRRDRIMDEMATDILALVMNEA
ncbi:glycosyltransferase family 4 protein [Billgrantia montanilacus]|uniref:Glycosyltransferase WbuB n=1 Tax=Billgrantia montanilacus TaxID=2282305 RepID=A0A368TX23_9GAMM|nr:glycosyltransferase family 4 protein [Halomonas montanilacus]RCV89369.1 glycosyltransferase WbuB [Halomonas montanilacus]